MVLGTGASRHHGDEIDGPSLKAIEPITALYMHGAEGCKELDPSLYRETPASRTATDANIHNLHARYWQMDCGKDLHTAEKSFRKFVSSNQSRIVITFFPIDSAPDGISIGAKSIEIV